MQTLKNRRLISKTISKLEKVDIFSKKGKAVYRRLAAFGEEAFDFLTE